jgi:glyoxylase-like metal-dependent hydrolase (beta-lactamase superfamily II)
MHASDKDNIRSVNYEFDGRPDAGETMPVAHGIFWLRMPLPFAMGHINLWLLEDGDDWTIVDTGVAIDESKQVWKRTFLSLMAGRRVNRVIVTHLHPDHVGCAGWLTGIFDVTLWMTREEYLLCRILVADTGRDTPEAGTRFYTAAGFPSESLHHYQKLFGMFGKYVSPLPESFRRMKSGDSIEIGDTCWEVIIGRGHSPEHACLYCAENNILISGDQLLPTISSNVSVYPTEPEANPLADWLDSLALLKSRIPEDVLVLPAHGKPFRGAHGRLDALTSEHNECLDELEKHCIEPRRAVDTFPVLFKSAINNNNLIMAAGESVAHLNYLLDQGRIKSFIDDDGVRWYES